MAGIRINGQHFDFNTARITNREGMSIESATDMTFTEVMDKASNGSLLALTALVWVVRKRNEPGLRFDDVDFALDDVEQVDDDETPDPTEGGAAPAEPTT